MHHPAIDLVIVHDQHTQPSQASAGDGQSASSLLGSRSVNQNVEPFAFTLFTSIDPPISSTRLLAIASPSPVPP